MEGGGHVIVTIADVLNAVPVKVRGGTVDTELPSAAALDDAASASPTTPTVGAIALLMNATTVDRQRAVVAALDSTGTGIAAAGIVGQFDDTSTATVTENRFAPVRISSRRALLVEGVASGTSMAVDTELPTAAALADNAANPTTALVGSCLLGFDGTTWDRLYAVADGDAYAVGTKGILFVGQNGTSNYQGVTVDSDGHLQVDILSGAGGGATHTDAASYSAASDDFAPSGGVFNDTILALSSGVGGCARITAYRGLHVNLRNNSGTEIGTSTTPIVADTELVAVAALADATANPTVTSVGVFNHLFNETTHDRQRGNTAVVELASDVRNSTVTGSDRTNYNARGIHLTIDMTEVGSGPSITPKIQAKDANGIYYDLLTGTAITTVSTNVLKLYPGLTAAANAVANDVLPRTFRIVITHNNANNGTYSVAWSLIL